MRENNNLLLLFLLIVLLPPSLLPPCLARVRVCVNDSARKKAKRKAAPIPRGQGAHLNSS